MGKAEEATTLMLEAVKHPTAQPVQIHQLGRQLQNAGKNKEALEIFEINHTKNGDARKALAQAPDDINRQSLTEMVKSLESGEAFKN